MLTLRHVALSNFDEPNTTLHELYAIFAATLNPDLSYREFRFFYFRHKPHRMDITFLQDGNKVAGFICVTFYKHTLDGKTYTICRGAAGIREGYRGGSLPSWQLCWHYIRYRLMHPTEKMYITGYMANPILYSMICRYTHKVYPKAGVPVPQHIHDLRDKLLQFYGMTKKVIRPFVLRIHFQVHLSDKDKQRIFTSTDKNVLFYLNLNPDFQQQAGVMTIVPVTWYNISVSAIRALLVKPLQKFFKGKKRPERPGKYQPVLPKA